MPDLPAFIGPAYQSRSVNVAADMLVNLYPEVVETTRGKHIAAYYGTPGLVRTHTLPGEGTIRGMYSTSRDGRAFAVRGGRLYELFLGGAFVQRGTIPTGDTPISFADNGLQMVLVDGDGWYVYTFADETLVHFSEPQAPQSAFVVFLDGYFVFLRRDGTFGVTGLYDAFSIDPLDFAAAEGSPDPTIAMATSHRELWLFGSRSLEVWYNGGGIDFPFQRRESVFIDYGTSAPHTLTVLDDTLYWLGSDQRGQHLVLRAEGYSPNRISTHAIEHAISRYAPQSIARSRAWAYQQEGHSFYVLNFDEATWVYDVSTQLWHQRAWLNNDGDFERHRAQVYSNVLTGHFVGDYENGNIYRLDLDHYMDDGREQVAMRRCPHFAGEDLTRLFHHWFQLDLEAGVGLDGPLAFALDPTVARPGIDPVLLLRYSDDGGHLWSDFKRATCGPIGQYRQRAIWRRLGRSRDRVYEIRQTDPAKRAWINAKIGVTPGTT